MNKAVRDLGVLLAGVLLLLSVRVGRAPAPDPVPVVQAASPVVARTDPAEPVLLEVRARRVPRDRDLGEAVGEVVARKLSLCLPDPRRRAS